jgi:hypothetical protein
MREGGREGAEGGREGGGRGREGGGRGREGGREGGEGREGIVVTMQARKMKTSWKVGEKEKRPQHTFARPSVIRIPLTAITGEGTE